jgi:hypothetical protein
MNGNMLSDGQRQVVYDDQDRPVQIKLGGVTTFFRYTPDGDRYLQRTTKGYDSSVNRTIYYVGKQYERVDWDNKPSEERTYCGKSVVIEQKSTVQAPFFTREVRYMHADRLGSTDAVTDSTGAEILTDGLGRFLSVDPLIANPASSQSINPYSYGGNNPLSGVDPTGYAFFTSDDGTGGLCANESGACDPGRGWGTIPTISKNGNVGNKGPGPLLPFEPSQLLTLGPSGSQRNPISEQLTRNDLRATLRMSLLSNPRCQTTQVRESVRYLAAKASFLFATEPSSRE